jgi:SAM-dependent methyltransferase
MEQGGLWPRTKQRLYKLPCLSPLVALREFVRGTDARYTRLLGAVSPYMFQPFSTTAMNRYPALFREAHAHVGDNVDARLLSFGCASGEEVFTLRTYFPNATIRGLDINPRNIARCQARLSRNPDAGLDFAEAGSAAAEPTAAYDAIFAMAVFRHGDLKRTHQRCDPLIHFAAFEESLTQLARCLRPGGLLVLRHANFRFDDTALASQFECLLERPRNADMPVYGPDNHQLTPLPTTEAVMFRKRATDGEGAQ